jgi:hypothetical protein
MKNNALKNDVTKNEGASERAVALVNETLDVMRRTECVPDSPLNTSLTAEMRRKCRRYARLLREQKAEPRYRNLHTAEELAGIYKRAAKRDEIRDQGKRVLHRLSLELTRIRKENAAEVEKAMVVLVREAARLAEEQGPGSEAAHRFRLMLFLAWVARQSRNHSRKSRDPFRLRVSAAQDPSVQARYELTAAEVLAAPPPDEAVIAIPPEGEGSGRPRVFLRIGLGEAAWIGSFEIGHMSVSTIVMMPDDKHLFVSAKGAGYIIELKSRALVEEIGTDIAGVMSDYARTLFIVDHDGRRLEAFGKNGRLWKTDIISFQGFRDTAITDTSITGELRHPSRPGWTRFSVGLATGEVGFGVGGEGSRLFE